MKTSFVVVVICIISVTASGKSQELLNQCDSILSQIEPEKQTTAVASKRPDDYQKHLNRAAESFKALPEGEQKIAAAKEIMDATKTFLLSLRDIITKIGAQVQTEENLLEVCPNSLEAATAIIGGNINGVEKEITGLKGTRRKRATNWKLTIKRTLSLTLGLPVHLLFISCCLLTAPTVVVAFRLKFLIIPLIFAIIPIVVFKAFKALEKIVIPSDDMAAFETAMRKYDAKIDKWGSIKK
ncbi:hypothetical protein Ddc_19151 [Ditylenchus destructor]|nr:hypothetical protein Ddc_19151 [Ditylenchus destructor]